MYKKTPPFLLLFLILSSFLFSQNDEEEKPGYRFRFRYPRVTVVREGEPPTKDAHAHGHDEMPAEEFARRVKDVTEYWNQRMEKGGPITKQDVVELYSRAGNFKVVHAILNDVIQPVESRTIGRLRQELHEETLELMAKSKEFGDRMGVNDFGSGADLEKVNAKTDIDFTSYAGKSGVSGSEMVGRYGELFRKVTAKYGKALDPGQMDIVAHQFEATIPDWRQNMSLADFEARLKTGLELLKSNPEAYFLEGAYLQQVMRRSVDPNKQTFAWYEFDAKNDINKTYHNAAQVPEFFYSPEIRTRYAWGASVGNWHFFHAHSDDLAGQAKYILRSIDDGAGMLLGRNKADEMEKLTPDQRSRVIDELYGGQFSRTDLEAFKALIETAVNIRELKSKDELRVATTADEVEAYKPLIEFERSQGRGVELSDETLLMLAKDRFQGSGNKLLVQNNILTSRERLKDWLSPELELGANLDIIDENGRWRRIRIDETTVTRLQYAAYFELKAALSLMNDAQISRIQDVNPRFRNDIEIIRKVIKKQKEMLNVPQNIAADEVLSYRQQLANEALQHYEHLKKVFRQKGYTRGILETGKTLWARGDQLEDWLQKGVIDKLAQSEGGQAYLPWLYQLRQSVDKTNEHLLGPEWMMRLDRGNSIIEILKAYIREGELINIEVGKTALWEGISLFPLMGTMFAVQSGAEGISTLYLVQVIPGYGQILLVGNFVKGVVELGGLMVFEPLRRDKVKLAYQGYLDPESSWWWPISSSQKERVISPRPHLLLPVDRDMTLSLEERREKMYEFFRNRIIPHIKHDYNIPANKPLPPELLLKEFEYLRKHAIEYVNHWWNGTGPIFGEYDVLTVHRTLDFRPDLVKMLEKDYLIGKNRYLQRKMDEREKKIQTLNETYEQIANEDIAIDEEGKSLSGKDGDYEFAGEVFRGYVLDKMPKVKPSIEIMMAPQIKESDVKGFEYELDRMTFRAKVNASMKEHPGPWKIEWKIDNPAASGIEGSSSAMNFSSPGLSENPAEVGKITISAIATDSKGEEIVRGSVQVEVEKVKVDKKPEDKEDAQTSQDDTPVGNDLIDRMDDLVRKASAESETIDKHCREGERKAQEGHRQAAQLERDTDSLSNSVDPIRNNAQQILQDLGQVERLKKEIDDAAKTIAEARDVARQNTVKVCEAALLVRKATTEDERKDNLQKATEALLKVQDAHNRAKEAYAKAQAAIKKLKDLYTRVNDLLEETDTFQSDLAKLTSRVGDADKLRGESNVDYIQTQIFSDKLGQTKNSGGEILEEAKSIDDPSLMDKLKDLYGRIVAFETNSADCPPQLKDKIEKLVKRKTQIETDLNEAGNNISEILASLNENGAIGFLKDTLDAAQATMAVLEIFMENIRERLDDASKCKEAAEKEMQKPITVVVPSVRELPLGEAKSVLKNAGLGITVVAGEKAPTQERSHTVDSQDPAAGDRVPPDTKVKVVMFGPYSNKVVVPDLKGKTVSEARAELGNDLNLAPVAGDAAPLKSKEHTIQSQNPGAYAEVEIGSTVTVRVYKSYAKSRIVPNVFGLKINEAEAVLKMSGFGISKVPGNRPSNKENEFVIYDQYPLPDHEAEENENTVTVTHYTSLEVDEQQQPRPRPEPVRPVSTTPSSGFFVAFSLYFPKIPESVPEGEKAKNYYTDYLRKLPIKKSSFVKNKDYKLFIYFYDEAIGTFKPEMFSRGKQFSSPFNISGVGGEGQTLNIPGAFLMEAEAVFGSFEELARQYPEINKKRNEISIGGKSSLFFLNIDNSDGMYSGDFAEKQGSGNFTGGPIYEGWPERQMKKNIEFVTIVIQLFDCFIATTVYQTLESPKLDTLREFRDKILAATPAGRKLINYYYLHGPGWAFQLRDKPLTAKVIEKSLDTFVWLLDHCNMDSPATRKALQIPVNILDWLTAQKEEPDEEV